MKLVLLKYGSYVTNKSTFEFKITTEVALLKYGSYVTNKSTFGLK